MTSTLRGDTDIVRAARVLHAGGVIIYPTETVYGFGCDPFAESACLRIQRLKDRDASKTFLLLASCRSQVEELTGPLDDMAFRLAERFWPGPLTIVLRPTVEVPSWLLGPSGGVACRVTPDPAASALIETFGQLVVSTSANRSGMPPLISGIEALAQFGNKVDMVLDAGIRDGIPSTILDISGTEPVILREGSISRKDIEEVF